MQLAENQRTRLHLEGVESVITADVKRRRADSVIVAQALPFLRRGTRVTESGRRARIARVDIMMDGDVPKLILELHDVPDDAQEEDDTVETFTPGVSAAPPRADATVPYELHGSGERSSEIVLTHAPPARPSPLATPPWYVRALRRLLAALASLARAPAYAALGAATSRWSHGYSSGPRPREAPPL